MKSVSSASYLQKEISSGKVIVVACTASWCGPCQQLKPQLPGLATQYPKSTWLSLDCSESNPIAAQYNVTGLPTVIVFAGGREVNRITGNRPQEIAAAVEAALKSAPGAAEENAFTGKGCRLGGSTACNGPADIRKARLAARQATTYRCQTQTNACGQKSTTCQPTGCP